MVAVRFSSPGVCAWVNGKPSVRLASFRRLIQHPSGDRFDVSRIPPTLLSLRLGHALSRTALIDRDWRPQLLEIINEEVKTRGGWPIRHNAMPDHAHLLCRLPSTVLIAEFIGQVKGATSFRVNKEIHPKFKLGWQEGYGVLTLRKDELVKVSRYIDRQEEHHRRGTLSDLLERFECEEDDWPQGTMVKAS